MTLERDLRDLGQALAYPATPDLAGAVLARLEAPAVPARWRLSTARVALAGAAAVLTLAVVVVIVPPAREAVADLLGIGRVRVETVPELPPVAAGLQLGEPVTLAEARASAPIPVVIPAELGAPDAVYLISDGGVTLAYAPQPGLPDVAGTGVGALLSELPGEGFPIVKQVTVDAETQLVMIDGEPGLWIEGGPHVVFFEERPGEAIESRGRLAGNTLLWQRDGVTLRLEADVDLDTALRIAGSVG